VTGISGSAAATTRRHLEVWSGGQGGVDRAALDVALELGLPLGGWVPRGRLAEDGPVPARYAQLREADSSDYAVRTRLNVQESDATVVLRVGRAAGGTLGTVNAARRLHRPLLEIDLDREAPREAAAAIRGWLEGLLPGPRAIRLNVAGPRASEAPRSYALARETLRLALAAYAPAEPAAAGVPGDVAGATGRRPQERGRERGRGRGLFLHPRRHAPARQRRSPRLERLTTVPLGWAAERLTAPLFRWDRARLATPEVVLAVRDLAPEPVGYRIALVTDLHHGPAVPARWLSAVAAKTAQLAPDLILLGGDFVSHARADLRGLAELIAQFRAPDGTLAVLGNHDHWVDPDAVAESVERGGARVLTNAHVLIRRGTGTLAVGGVDDFSHGAVRPDEAFAGIPSDVPRILLSHNPDLIEYLPAGLRVDAMLSGHTHNGQAHLPFLGPITAPSQFGRRYLHGLKRVGHTWLYVSAGIGSAWVPRWGNPPELPMIRLTAAA
jgi:uncharacterized protein